MNVLVFETSTAIATIAVGRAGPEILAAAAGPARGHASRLVSEVGRLVRQAGLSLRDLDAIGIGLGPGSFTGLRVGVTAAKTLAYAVGSPRLVGVDSFRVLAEAVPGSARRIRVAGDAQRGDLFAAEYLRPAEGVPLTRLAAPHLIPREDWFRSLEPGDTVVGPVLQGRDVTWPDFVDPGPEALAGPTPAALLVCCLEALAAGQADDPMRLVPHYLRRSAAEEKSDR